MATQSKLKLTPDESRLYGQLFKEADPDNTGFITGEVAVNFFGRTSLPQHVLGAIWDLVDPENRGFLMQDDFAKAMRLIGYSQANPGRTLDTDITLRPAPLPVFQGMNQPAAIRVPPLTPDDATKYIGLFEQTGATNGIIGGDVARQFFMRSGLPNEVLIAVWNLADTSQRGALGVTDFIVAMHLLSSYKSRTLTALPKQCPPALFEAAARFASRPSSIAAPPAAIPRQFSGAANQRMGSPATRGPGPAAPPPSDWVVAAQKPSFDEAFDKLDTQRTGLVAADQAANYFRNSGLSDGTLAQIWDLANIRKADQLNRDEFAVAMYLIRTQRSADRVDLPQTLPLGLVPPSLRSFVTAQASGAGMAGPVPAPQQKSASEDLFGLDELTSPSSPAAPVIQQSTGGPSAFGDPFSKPVASPTSAPVPARGFKPFMPTSSFGQGLQTQNTGGSAASSARDARAPPALQPSAMDDLLGDADPEVSKKLTSDTAELANMSNQIGQLRNQMQEVSNKKATSERDLASTSIQKRDLELRLSQFRGQYETEVKAVRAIEEQLQSIRSDTQNLQRELAMVEGTYQDLQNQHHQAATALDNERRENASLKERMSQLNQEISRLRPELEDMRNKARHEKGMASINKKQMEKSETERDALNKSLQEAKQAPLPVATPSESIRSPPVTSPASQNTNPFFRRSPQPPAEAALSPSNFAPSPPSEANNAFDNIWGNAFSPSASTSRGPPPTSFAPFGSQSGPSMSSNDPTVFTPSTSPPASSYKDSPRPNGPPELPESRQMTSSDLPIRGAGAESSVSMRVETPASRRDGNETPTAASNTSATAPPLERSSTAASAGATLFDRGRTSSPVASVASQASKARFSETSEGSRALTPATGTIPGAFPGTQTSPIQSQLTGESSFTTGSGTRNGPYPGFSSSTGGDQPSRSVTAASTGSRGDFDSVFANRAPPSSAQPGRSVADDAFGSRFPPVNSLVNEEDSESDSEPEGFDDDFTAASPGKGRAGQSGPIAPASDLDKEARAEGVIKPRTATGASPEDLPPIEAQQSPPDYSTTTHGAGQPAGLKSSESGNFPPEFTGLLPQRELSMSPPAPAQSPSQGAALFGGAPVQKVADTTSSSTVRSGDYHSASSQAGIPGELPRQTTTSSSIYSANPKASVGSFGGDDDFDAGFDDLEDAKPDNDADKDDDFFPSRHHGGDNSFEEFNPTFDSPAASKSNTLASDFDAGFGSSTNTFGRGSMSGSTTTAKGLNQSSITNNTNEWDSFMTSSSSQKVPDPPISTTTNTMHTSQSGNPGSSGSRLFPESSSGAPHFPEAPEPPKLGRALTEGTEHDDPILKQLTGMGYERQAALRVLEKYDYNLEKAIDNLAKSR